MGGHDVTADEAMSAGGQVLKAKVRVPRVKALARERLQDLLARVWDARLGLVLAPAGSGKTTLLAQFAADSGVPAAWYRAEPGDASEAALVAHLERSLRTVLDDLPAGWGTIDDAIAALEDWPGERAVVLIDELDALWGTEAEAALERFVLHTRPGIPVVASTRRAPTFNLSRLLVQGDLVQIGEEDLRFRSWEVEHLFHDFYRDPVPPHEIAELARRTAGWAAGLQLFHLATRGKTALERRQVLYELGLRSRLVREYLARNVLDDLPVHVRDFLLRTCVLGRLTAAMCDELTGSTSGAAILADLEQRQIFTAALDAESYRYHEVLRTHLEAALLDAVGEREARDRYREAGAVLERHGHLPEALRAYLRGEDHAAARRLLGGRGEQVIDGVGEWLDAVPPALGDHDAWLLLGSARRAVALGRWDAALDAYGRAAVVAGAAQPGDVARRERQALAGWFAPPVPAPTDWTAALRLAVARDPMAVIEERSSGMGPGVAAFAAALAALLAGDVDVALERAASVEGAADASPVIAVGAGIVRAVAAGLAVEPVAGRLGSLSEQADAVGVPWLAALARSALALDAAAPPVAATVPKEDPWGGALAELFAGLGALARGEDGRGALADAAAGFTGLDAAVLAAWAAAAGAAAEAEHEGAPTAARVRRAAHHARALGLPGAAALASVGLVFAEPDQAGAHRAHAEAAARDLGLGLVAAVAGRAPAGPTGVDPGGARAGDRASLGAVDEARSEGRVAGPSSDGIAVRCLGGLELVVGGAPVDLSAVKPRVRSLVRLLAMCGSRPVHRETIVEALWPDADARVGTRNLQVAVSSLRQLLEPGVARGEASVVVRDGDAYRLSVEGDIDVERFERHLAAGRALAAGGQPDAARAALLDALGLYRGDLFPEEGPSEWVVGERSRLRSEAADACAALAELALATGDAAGAARAAEQGLHLERYRDRLWRLLVRAHDEAGDAAAATHARARYAEVLDELGVAAPPA